MSPDRLEIVRSYRNLYRHALRAVQYSSPARYTLKSHLRLAYRSNGAEAFNSTRIGNTLLFLQHAAEERGLEHRMLKSLLHVWWWQAQPRVCANSLPTASSQARSEIGSSAFGHFNVTVRLLNESMQLCLPERGLNPQAIRELDHWKQVQFFGGHSQSHA
ncbi:MAG: hypothetical protein L6R36_001871 [Xanthoria steineri]|nr:MAG: hypothetical protein L6R36_001871 [Xanthoria steineri]